MDPMHRELRERFLAVLRDEKAAAVIPTGSLSRRNADSEYRFRPESDFFYLTGFEEPDSVLVLLPGAEEGEEVLFLRERDEKAEIWNGRRLGVEAAEDALGVDRAFPVGELWEKLPELLEDVPRLVYRFGIDEEFDRRMIRAATQVRTKVRPPIVAPSEWIDPARWLHEQRLFKTPGEIETIRRAAAITTEAHVAAMREAKPGMNEGEIDALLGYVFRRRGGSGEAYNNIAAGGANACILHYIENNMPLAGGDLLLIDAGAELGFYASDVTRTFPVNGRFTAEQRALYDVVLGAQVAVIEASKPGATMSGLHELSLKHLTEGLVSLELIEGPVEKAIEEKTYEKFTVHKTGHFLGLDVHDCGSTWVGGI